MHERVKYIVDRIRMDLGETEKNKYPEPYLFNIMNAVQNEILLETHCVKTDFEITTEAGVADYDVIDFNCLLFTEATLEPEEEAIGNDYGMPALNPQLKIATFDQFNKYRGLPYGQPERISVENQRVFLMPIPDAVYKARLYGFLIRATSKIDKDNPPMLPEYADEALIDGVKSKFNRDYLGDYMNQKRIINSNAHNTGASYTPSADWLD